MRSFFFFVIGAVRINNGVEEVLVESSWHIGWRLTLDVGSRGGPKNHAGVFARHKASKARRSFSLASCGAVIVGILSRGFPKASRE